MRFIFSRKSLIVFSIVIVCIVGVTIFFLSKTKQEPVKEIVQENLGHIHKTIGQSIEKRSIESYTFGKGKTHLAFVGGIHGGYEWNSVLVAYKLIDYLTDNPKSVPNNLTVTIIPSANPDGVFKVVGKEGRFTSDDALAKDPADGTGRFNANNVDLNRNFDCNWKSTSTWKNKTVSAGKSAFSEPEALVIKNFIENDNPSAVVFFHSQSNAVYASECNNGILPETLDIMNTYSKASGYRAIKTFDSYAITGDAEGWLASINIPAITVELETHKTIEWERNLKGVIALFNYYKI